MHAIIIGASISDQPGYPPSRLPEFSFQNYRYYSTNQKQHQQMSNISLNFLTIFCIGRGVLLLPFFWRRERYFLNFVSQWQTMHHWDGHSHDPAKYFNLTYKYTNGMYRSSCLLDQFAIETSMPRAASNMRRFLLASCGTILIS